MGVQGNAERGEKSRNTRLIFLLVYLVLRLSVISTAKQSYEVERAIRAKEREEAQLAEAQSAWDEAMLVQAQVTDDRAPQFAADADVRTVEGVGSLSFAIPAAWGDGVGLSSYESVFLAPSTYDGQCWAIAVPDLCLSSATARDAADFLFAKVRSLSLAGDAVWSGALGRAVWYRYPVVDTGADHLSYESGFLEVILTGRDAYFLVTVCEFEFTLVFMDEDAIEELRCVYEGAGEFSVYAAGCDGSASLVDASGPCDETVAWDDPHTLFVVHADGDWRLSW